MNDSIRQHLGNRKRQILGRLDKSKLGDCSKPVFSAANIHYDVSKRVRGLAFGGIGAFHLLARRIGLIDAIDKGLHLLKIAMPYHESDHVLNIAYNPLCNGDCLQDIELRRNNAVFLDALGARRIPDPTTAGDFCRRFDEFQTLLLMQGINRARRTVWKQQDDAFFAQATIEADGSMVETRAEKKEGIGMNYKGQWGYHPLVVSLAETQEVLYLANRPGNRPSHEHATFYFDLAIDECRQAGFRKIRLRGDTDFSLTENFDRWDDDGVDFVFGLDAMPNLVEIAENLDESAWTGLRRKTRPSSGKPRARRPNHKAAFVREKGYKNLTLRGESYAEFGYRPTKCSRSYRVVVVRKRIDVEQGQSRLFDEVRYFFYITNATRSDLSPRSVVASANRRCNQENTISQLKACGALAAPLDSLASNGAYMAMASLAWTLKCWCGLMVRPEGRQDTRAAEQDVRHRVIRMEFATFLNSFMQIPAQVIRTARRLVYRLLTYRPSVDALLVMHAHVQKPLRC